MHRSSGLQPPSVQWCPMTKALRRPLIATFMLIAGLAGSGAAFAGLPGDRPDAQGGQQAQATPRPTHAVRGVVKSIDATSLVIKSSRRKPNGLVFVLNSSTLREGTIAVGSTISVRYQIEGDTLVATAVTARTDHAVR